MIKIVQTGKYDDRCVVVCNSSDEKPIDKIPHGSLCEECDTGKIYIFDEENKQWNEVK